MNANTASLEYATSQTDEKRSKMKTTSQPGWGAEEVTSQREGH